MLDKLSTSQWMVSGDVDPSMFSDAYTFRDESVSVAGVRPYALGVRKLFDQASSTQVRRPTTHSGLCAYCIAAYISRPRCFKFKFTFKAC